MTQPSRSDIERMIRQTDSLIGEVSKFDPIAAMLLQLARSELVTCKAVKAGNVLRLPVRRH